LINFLPTVAQYQVILKPNNCWYISHHHYNKSQRILTVPPYSVVIQ
jgi:hypothetical protein